MYHSMKIADIVRKYFIPLVESGKLTEEEIVLMQTVEYSKLYFKLSFPLLVASNARFDRDRYYKGRIFVNNKAYYLCSQWTVSQKAHLTAWLLRHVPTIQISPIEVEIEN